ncbi:MAG: hypothetical protein LQ340_006664 [Diploschistes diacapsis]|nr:MAG: hypothetical protein LQ340_006664 [Diploschistes diacapsis]
MHYITASCLTTLSRAAFSSACRSDYTYDVYRHGAYDELDLYERGLYADDDLDSMLYTRDYITLTRYGCAYRGYERGGTQRLRQGGKRRAGAAWMPTTVSMACSIPAPRTTASSRALYARAAEAALDSRL